MLFIERAQTRPHAAVHRVQFLPHGNPHGTDRLGVQTVVVAADIDRGHDGEKLDVRYELLFRLSARGGSEGCKQADNADRTNNHDSQCIRAIRRRE